MAGRHGSLGQGFRSSGGSYSVVEGKSPEQVEKLLIQEIKEPEVDIDPDVEKEITELQEKKLNEEKKDALCKDCSGEDKGKPIQGLVIIKGLEKDGDEYTDGKILDPSTGKLYKCYIALEEPNKLKVRGYVGFSLLGRTQYWHRVE